MSDLEQVVGSVDFGELIKIASGRVVRDERDRALMSFKEGMTWLIP